ncbi:MAG: hypothetical protein IJC45_08080 [Clostridia bacterium]|nr:hypothetical protein [Clostridia bacterium]
MKKCYKLFGVFWDQREIVDSEIFFYDEADVLQDWKEPFNLFDFHGYKRKVAISTLLSVEKEEDIAAIIDRVKTCDEVIIDLDYCPLVSNRAIVCFYLKRVLQIYSYMVFKLPDSKVYFLLSFPNMKDVFLLAQSVYY